MRIAVNKLGRLLAVALLPLAPLVAGAQTTLTGYSRPYIAGYGTAPLEIYSQDRDVLQLYAGAEVEHHSNIFALPDDVDPTLLYGNSSRSDTLLRGLVGVSFDRQVSLQRFRLDASLLPVKYVEYSNFDYLGYSAGGHWDWASGRTWFGMLGARFTQDQTPFGNYFRNAKNLERRAKIYGSAGIRLTPSWAAFVGLDTETLDNSFSGVQAADFQFDSAETGLRYAPGTGNIVDFVWRHTNGDYPNRQVEDAFGNLLPTTLDNGFQQNALLARLQVAPSNDSRIAGNIGYTSRKYDNLSQRDFGGITAGLNVNWRPTGALTMGVELIRDIQSQELLTANYVDLTSLRLRPRYQLTGKTALFGQAIFSRASYEGNPGFVAVGAVRKDDIMLLGIGVAYDFDRNVTVNLEARWTERDSNYARFTYDDAVLAANVLVRF